MFSRCPLHFFTNSPAQTKSRNSFILHVCLIKQTQISNHKRIQYIKNHLLLNKRPMGHIAHLRKQFTSINTYDYIITMIKRRKKTLLS